MRDVTLMTLNGDAQRKLSALIDGSHAFDPRPLFPTVDDVAIRPNLLAHARLIDWLQARSPREKAAAASTVGVAMRSNPFAHVRTIGGFRCVHPRRAAVGAQLRQLQLTPVPQARRGVGAPGRAVRPTTRFINTDAAADGPTQQAKPSRGVTAAEKSGSSMIVGPPPPPAALRMPRFVAGTPVRISSRCTLRRRTPPTSGRCGIRRTRSSGACGTKRSWWLCDHIAIPRHGRVDGGEMGR